MRNRVRITHGFYLTGALMLLLLPLRWVMSCILAALVHELCHCIAVYLCGGQVLSVSLGAFGARMEASPMDRGKDALCALAGPLGSFFMVSTAEYLPEAALCGLVQGAYNLLPIDPLDGGQILRYILPESICFGVLMFAYVFLGGLGLWILIINRELGILVLLSLWILGIRRKIACKEGC